MTTQTTVTTGGHTRRTALAAAKARAGLDIQHVLSEELFGEGPVEVRREPRAEGSERIEVYGTGRRGPSCISLVLRASHPLRL